MNKKRLIITSLLTLLPIPVGLLLWNRFPETMAIHFSFSGQPDNFVNIPTAVFLPPLLMLLAHWFCVGITALDKGNRNRNQKMQAIVAWVIPVVCNLSCCGIYALALGVNFSPVMWTMVPLGILFILIGNYMPKTRMNGTIGIRVPWTYSSEENWNASHRFGGKVWVIGGFLMMLGGFLPHGPAVTLMLALIVPMCVLPIAFSWLFYKKELAAGKDVKIGSSRTNPRGRKISCIFLVLLTVFICFILFFGDIEYTFHDDYLLVESNMYTDYILRYDTIESLEYREGNVPGLRVGGYGSFRLLMGFFENQEFGVHTRYTYYDPESCIIAYTGSGAVVLSAETGEETHRLYLMLEEKIN